MPSKFERLPYSGVVAALSFLATMTAVYPEDYRDPRAADIINDHGLENAVAVIAMGLCGVAMLFFAAAVRAALRSGEGGESTYSSVAFGAAVVIAVSKLIDSWLLLSGVSAAGQSDADALHVLGYLGDASWLPWVAASAAFYLAVGIGGLHTALLPRWLSVVTVVLGAGCLLGPIGMAVYFATPVWLAVAGFVLARRMRAPAAASS
jgi:hypothetical protein